MTPDVISVEPVRGHVLRVRFENGVVGEVDLAEHLEFEGIFEPLKDPAYVAKVRIIDEGVTIGWPNSADIDPVTLYSWVTGRRAIELEG